MDAKKLLELMLEDPSTIEALAPELVAKYKKPIYAIAKEIFGIAKDYANNDEVFELAATLKKKQFDAYVSVGFTEEQAIAFIINDNLKLMEQIKKTNKKVSTDKK